MRTATLVKYPVIDADGAHLFEPPNLTGSPERNLLLAILERAVLDYIGNQKNEALLAEEWIFCKQQGEFEDVFSFPWVCSQLDLDPDKILRAIANMPKRGESRLAPWYWPDYNIVSMEASRF